MTELSQLQQQSKTLEPWEIEWQRCKPLIEKAIKHQDMYSIEDVEEQRPQIYSNKDEMFHL